MKKGSHMTVEQRARVSESRKGVVAWNKGRRGIKQTTKDCIRCGKTYQRDPDSSNYLWLKRTFCSKSCALKGNKRTLGMFLGELNPSWKGGITTINATLRSSTQMNEWRKSVFERDNYTCQGCLVRGGKLHAHHIKAFSRFPELRFELTNGQTLCYPCHRLTDNYAGRA